MYSGHKMRLPMSNRTQLRCLMGDNYVKIIVFGTITPSLIAQTY